MTYHEVKIRGKKRYNYLVKNMRSAEKWKKIRKYIGEGKIPKNIIEKEQAEFQKKLINYSYLSEKQREMIEQIKIRFDSYLKKGGKSGLDNFNEWFFTELTYNSNAIEGTSLSLRETSMIINDGIIPKNTSLREINEAKNHKKSLEFLLNYKSDVNENLIKKLHSIIMENIDENRGKYRNIPVFIIGYDVRLPKPNEVPKMMKELINWYKNNKRIHPIELAAIFSMKFVTIHPFTDGNGRISRLLMNYILKKNSYPEINIYVKDRNNYLKSVRAANDEKYEMIIEFLFRTMQKNYQFLKEMKG